MKKLIFSLSLFLSFSSLVHAQWATSGNNVTNTNTGNIGIGVPNPTNKLDVAGVINTQSYMTSTLGFYVPSTLNGMNNNLGGNTISFRTGNVENRMVIDGSGNVGIGITTPAEKLTINGNLRTILDPNPSFISKNVVRLMTLGVSGITGAQNWTLRGVYQYGGGVLLNSDGGDLDIIKSLDGNTILGTKFDGTALGSIGIGTTTPAAQLDVAANSSIGTKGGKFNTPLTLIKNGDANGTDNPVLLIKHSGNGSNIFGNAATDIGIINIQGFNTTVANKAINSNNNFYVFTNGTVGVNTNYIPSGYQLAVNGSAIATAVTVQLKSNWPDYVFKKDYQLPSLQEVKTYIDQNQHLPEVPSAEQIAKDGLNLGEMNKLLMKKVEELTLYMIEMKEEIKDLQKQNKDLKKRTK